MTPHLEIKGVGFSTGGLSGAAREWLESKRVQMARRSRPGRQIVRRILEAFLPRDYRRVEIETHLAGRGRVLVVGCSAAVETLALAASNREVVGLDIDRPMLRIAAELRARAGEAHRGAGLLAASGADLPFPDGRFDALLSDNVVEHIPDGALRRHLREARRVLRPGGVYVFSTPNAAFEIPPREGHVSLHTFAEWEALLGAAGFSDVRTPRRRSGPPVDLAWKKSREGRRGAWGSSHAGLRMVTLFARSAPVVEK